MSKAANRNDDRQTTAPISAPDLSRLKVIVDKENGDVGAARRLGIPRGTIARALAGLPVRAGTAALIAARLRERAA